MPTPDIAPPALVVDLVVDTVARNSGQIDIRIYGELDIATHDVLLVGLAAVELDERSVIRLHLGRLTFCDAHGGSLLLDYVDQTRRRARAVSIENSTPAVRKLLGLLETWTAITAAITSRDRAGTTH